MCVADIKVMPFDEKNRREVVVNGISIPDVTEISLLVRGERMDEVALIIHADSFQLAEREK